MQYGVYEVIQSKTKSRRRITIKIMPADQSPTHIQEDS